MAYLGKTCEPEYFFHADQTTLDLARRLRRKMTPCEKLLWKRLKARNVAGAKFRRQHPIGFFIADFYCHEARLVIEVDGLIHLNPGRREQDAKRDAEMNRLGIRILRFTNDEIKYSIRAVLKRIREAIAQ
jgi:very-short-patch-repair endonuclease